MYPNSGVCSDSEEVIFCSYLAQNEFAKLTIRSITSPVGASTVLEEGFTTYQRKPVTHSCIRVSQIFPSDVSRIFPQTETPNRVPHT